MKANFLFELNKDYSIQDAYVLGNLFSYNYIDTASKFSGKRASFLSIKAKPQSSNSVGFEYTRESFEEYKSNLLKFFATDPKYKDIDIKILWDDDSESDGAFKKIRGRRVLYFNLDFDFIVDYNEILNTVRKKINKLSLFIWFFRGIIDTRGSIDKTTKKIAVDMDSRRSFDQAREITMLSEKYFKDIAKFTNYNPRNEQPSEVSQKKNSQMRPHLHHYLTKIGTINPQLIRYYSFIYKDNWELSSTDSNEFFVEIENYKEIAEQKERLEDLRVDDKIKREDKGHIVPFDLKVKERRYISTEDKIDIWSNLFSQKTLDEEEIDFVLMEWHHAIPNALKKDNTYSKYHWFIDTKENYFPLSPNRHTLIHKSDKKLSEGALEEKRWLLLKLHSYLIEHIDIEKDTLFNIYK